MSLDVRHYDVILSPVITEKATAASDYNGHGPITGSRTTDRFSAPVERLFDVKVTAVNTLLRKGKAKTFRGFKGRQADLKKAVVTLAPGHKIDVTTGL